MWKIALNMLCSVPCCEVHQFIYLFIYFFFVALHGFTFKLQQFNRSEVLSQNSKQQSCFWKSVYSCCKMFSTYSFPNGISNYICGLTVKRFRSPLKKTPNSKFPFLKFSLELLLQRVHRLQFSKEISNFFLLFNNFNHPDPEVLSLNYKQP